MINKFPLNTFIFVVVVFVVGLLSYFFDENEMKMSTKPWHMQMNENGDDLSSSYENQYKLLDHGKVFAQLDSFEGTLVLILIDAWGIPYDETKLNDEIAVFKDLPHEFYLHKRLMSYTKFAEQAEFRTKEAKSMFLFGGDSLEYGRNQYVRKLGYGFVDFCQNCGNQAILQKVDSLLNSSTDSKLFAISLQLSRIGEGLALKRGLQSVHDLIERHPDVRFVVQGTHRPILVSREEREKYYQYWVPVVVINSRKSVSN